MDATCSLCTTATGQWQPGAWCGLTGLTGSSRSCPWPSRGGRERRVSAVWRGAVRVTGAEFGALAHRFEKDGQIEGLATATGLWSGDQLRVEHRAAPAPPVTHARWVKPPCPPPEGSRPTVIRHGHIELDYDRGNLADTGAAVAITLFRPGDNQAVLVAAADPAAVEARLGPDLGGSTASCVLARL